MVNVSLKEDEGRFIVESLIKRLDKKKNPNLMTIQFTDVIISKMKKAFRQNKHSPVFLKTIVNELTRIGTRWGVEKAGQAWRKAQARSSKK